MGVFTVPSVDETKILTINKFKGINLSVDSTQLEINESPDMLNMQLDTRGALEKRTGYKKIFESLGNGKVNGLFLFAKKDGTKIKLMAYSTKLYSWNEGEQPVELYNGLSNNRVTTFTMEDKLYILDGTHFIQYDGTTFRNVEDIAYVPTLTMGRTKDGGGDTYEGWNLLSPYFQDSFSPDGTAKSYPLSLKNLDATPVIASLDGGVTYTKLENTDFTVDRTTGITTWTTAPPQGTNSLVIKAAKTQAGFTDRIKKCTVCELYGGSNDIRVFLTGNPDYPNTMWKSDILSPLYFEENGYYDVGSDSDRIMRFRKQYDTCAIIKEKSVYNMQYLSGSLTIKPINDQYGCYALESIQTIDNDPVFLDNYGVCEIASTSIRDERNISQISDRVNRKLLEEPNLDKAVSFDYQNKYGIAVNGNVYIWDYRLNEWYIWNNINASCFFEYEGNLYFGSNTEGVIYRFKKTTESYPYNDEGQIITCYWNSKLLDFGYSERLKATQNIFYGLKPSAITSVEVYYSSDNSQGKIKLTETRQDLFDYSMLDYATFNYGVNELPQECADKLRQKKFSFMQFTFRNSKLDEGLGLVNLIVKFTLQGYKR
jgi:hypothetical protein